MPLNFIRDENNKRILVDEKGYPYFYSLGPEEFVWKCFYCEQLKCRGLCKTSSWDENGITLLRLFYYNLHL